MGYHNPLLQLPAGRALADLPLESRLALFAMLMQLREQANAEAENSWKRRKGPMAAYWRAVSTYARHTAMALRKGGERLRQQRRYREQMGLPLLQHCCPSDNSVEYTECPYCQGEACRACDQAAISACDHDTVERHHPDVYSLSDGGILDGTNRTTSGAIGQP